MTMASSQSFSSIQRRISLSPEPQSPLDKGEPLKMMAIRSAAVLAIHFGTSLSQNALRWRQLLPSASRVRPASAAARHSRGAPPLPQWLDDGIGCLACRLRLRSRADSDDTPGPPGYAGLLALRFALLCSSMVYPLLF